MAAHAAGVGLPPRSRRKIRPGCVRPFGIMTVVALSAYGCHRAVGFARFLQSQAVGFGPDSGLGSI
jgi:hypothetical protein